MALRVAFLFYGPQQPELAKRMVSSVREHMPNAVITQLTDTRSRALDFVDEVRRIDGTNYGYLVYKHMATLPEPFIRLDYDMLIQGDLSYVLGEDTDLAFNTHSDPTVVNSQWGQKYPWASCLWAARAHAQDFAESFRGIHILSGRDDWLGLVPSVNEAIEASPYAIKTLDGQIYNYTPKNREDKPKEALVIHYKGRRKAWMLPEGQEHLVRQDSQRISKSVKGYQFK